jgi:ABC-type phosphate transport system permease subunit
MIGLHSTHIYKSNLTTAVTTMVTLVESPFDRQQNNIMVWVYGVMTVFLLVFILLVLSLVLVSISKCGTQQKSSKHNNIP